jgi:acetyl esterase/lipase
VVLDMIAMTDVDITGIDTLGRLDSELAAKNITLVLAGRQVEFEQWLQTTKHPDAALRQRAFPTMRQAVRHWRGRNGARSSVDEAEDTRGSAVASSARAGASCRACAGDGGSSAAPCRAKGTIAGRPSPPPAG